MLLISHHQNLLNQPYIELSKDIFENNWSEARLKFFLFEKNPSIKSQVTQSSISYDCFGSEYDIYYKNYYLYYYPSLRQKMLQLKNLQQLFKKNK